MTSLQPQSVKIQKKARTESDGDKNFICGGCERGYKSYPALYLHVKRKHNGIIPPNTQTLRAARPALHISVQPGRPNKPSKDIDDLKDTEQHLEVAQNELMSFLGEKLMVTSDFSPKVTLESVVTKILAFQGENRDQWFINIQNKAKELLAVYQEKDVKQKNIDFEEDIEKLNPEDGLQIMTWFVLWLGKIYVKADFLFDLCTVFSKIWKILEDTQLGVQDLDNKLVWKKVTKECEELMKEIPNFKNDINLLYDFIQKVCQLIGKTFEQPDRL